jgi:hypothetical protein
VVAASRRPAKPVTWLLVSACRHSHGLWRSLVAHLTGGQGVASSNLVSPTARAPITHVSGASVLAGAARSSRTCGLPRAQTPPQRTHGIGLGMPGSANGPHR